MKNESGACAVFKQALYVLDYVLGVFGRVGQ